MLLCVNENIPAHNEANGAIAMGCCAGSFCYNCVVIGGSVVKKYKQIVKRLYWGKCDRCGASADEECRCDC